MGLSAAECKAAKIDEIRKQGHILTPGRYVGAEEEADDEEEFEEKMQRLTIDLADLMNEGNKLDDEIKKNLSEIGWAIQ